MTKRLAIALPFVLAVAAICSDGHAAATVATSEQVPVTWDFGSGPGRTSNVYVGNRVITVRYTNSECKSRFTLESATVEFANVVKDGKATHSGPPLLTIKLRKRFSGDFDRLPKITIIQNNYDAKGTPTSEKSVLVFPFREKSMAAPVGDWSRADLEVSMGAPAEAMKLHNPLDWQDIEVQCE
jgi:hypothetical protein